jgi:transcriptional regulator with XRE-family HTH domain
LSLQDVQRATRGQFKAAVLGAYERGERALSVPRLHSLAEFFAVPVTQLLPAEEDAPPVTGRRSGGVTIDLNRVEGLTGVEAELFDRFLRGIQMQRQDFNGRVLTLRRDDLRILALLLGQDEGAFTDRLGELNAAG